jgi:hypothetical protein
MHGPVPDRPKIGVLVPPRTKQIDSAGHEIVAYNVASVDDDPAVTSPG